MVYFLFKLYPPVHGIVFGTKVSMDMCCLLSYAALDASPYIGTYMFVLLFCLWLEELIS